jgi:hypothetical protein
LPLKRALIGLDCPCPFRAGIKGLGTGGNPAGKGGETLRNVPLRYVRETLM